MKYRCMDNKDVENELTKGKVYAGIPVNVGDSLIRVINDQGKLKSYSITRFIMVNE